MTDAQTSEAPAPTKRRLVLPIAAALSCLAGAAASYFLAPTPNSGGENPGTLHEIKTQKPTSAETKTATHKNENGKKKDSQKNAHGKSEKEPTEANSNNASLGRFTIIGDVGVYVIEPFVISIKPSGRIKYLKLGVAIETGPTEAERFFAQGLRIRDALNTYLRAVDMSVLEDPTSLNRIRTQIGRRVGYIVGPSHVRAVLITDFILS